MPWTGGWWCGAWTRGNPWPASGHDVDDAPASNPFMKASLRFIPHHLPPALRVKTRFPYLGSGDVAKSLPSLEALLGDDRGGSRAFLWLRCACDGAAIGGGGVYICLLPRCTLGARWPSKLREMLKLPFEAGLASSIHPGSPRSLRHPSSLGFVRLRWIRSPSGSNPCMDRVIPTCHQNPHESLSRIPCCSYAFV